MIKVIHQGLGPIGQETAKLVLNDSNLKIVGALDINLEYIGKDLGDLLETNYLGIKINNDTETLFKETKPDVVVLATCSDLEKIIPSLEVAIKNKVNIISPAEELFYPEYVNKEKAEYIDKLAKKHNVRVLGIGVNPGYLMDTYSLHIYENAVFSDLISMVVHRWDDTTSRRLSLLKKTGAGLSKEEFYELDHQKKLGHVGLKISAAYLADNIGLKDYKIKFKREPVIKSEKVAGLHETCSVIVDEQEKIILDLRMYVGAKNKNSIKINGKSFDYDNIVNGDISTT